MRPSRRSRWARLCMAASKMWAVRWMAAPDWARCASAWTRPIRQAAWSAWKSKLQLPAELHAVWRRMGAGLVLALLLTPAVAQADDLQLSTMIHAALDHGSKLQHANIALKLAQARLQQAEGAF